MPRFVASAPMRSSRVESHKANSGILNGNGKSAWLINGSDAEGAYDIRPSASCAPMLITRTWFHRKKNTRTDTDAGTQPCAHAFWRSCVRRACPSPCPFRCAHACECIDLCALSHERRERDAQQIGTLATEASFIRFACLYSTSGLWNAAAWTGAMYAMAGITFCGGSRKPFHQCMRSARKANLVGHSDLGCEVILNEERDKVTPNEAAAS